MNNLRPCTGTMPTLMLAGVLLWTALLSLPGRLAAHTLHDGAEATTGLDERLGAKIPLDLPFRDEAGRTVLIRDLVTGPTILLPVYYRCTNVCNFLQSGLAVALPAVRLQPAGDYRVISVSFDETETPALASRARQTHLTAMNAPFPADGWHFLTGDRESIRRLTDAAGFHFQRKGHDFVHPVASIIIARDGTIVRYLYGTNFLAKDLNLALLEAKSGTVGTTIRKAVAYCFSFDPTGKTYVFNLLRVSGSVVFLTAGGFFAFLLYTGRKQRRHSTRNQ